MGGVGEKILVSALTGVMSPLLGKLANLIEEEYVKLKGPKKKMGLLTKELIAINVALEKYATMEKPDGHVKAWMKEVRELAYDIEDCIDLFIYRVDHEPADKVTGIKFLGKSIHKLKKLHYRHKFADEIQELKALADEIYVRYTKYKLDGCCSSTMHTEIDPRLPALYVEVEKLVGIEGPSNEFINRFIDKENGPMKQRRVVSIVGSGGSGKTTLANQVYQKTKGRFFCTAFVSISQKPNMNSLLKDLISQIERSSESSDRDQPKPVIFDRQVTEPSRHRGLDKDLLTRPNSVQELIERLRECLEHKKYLIVIDDIWSRSAWETIQCALPENIHASRIISTTRINDVAKFCCASDEAFVYEMKPLSRSDSENLFLTRTFGVDDKCPGQLKGIMDEILHKCDGLPLAIVTISSLLANKPRRREEWERMRNSIGSVRGKDKDLEVIDKILSLSYSDLPHCLKTCVLYLSIFSEDYKIEKDSIVWRWIAEGFIASKQGYTLEEVGESYFNELINRSLIHPIDMGYDGKASVCRVHDIVLKFILSLSVEENFISMLDDWDLSCPHEKIRRLSFRNKNEHAGTTSQGTMNLSHLRSLHLFRVVRCMPPLLDLQVLRVLDLEGCDSLKNDHLENIGGLFHLRYLGLRNTQISQLPVQIGKLEFLQSLDVRETRITELPEAIIHLKRLMRLVGSELILPDGFGNMEAIQELHNLDVCYSSTNFAQDLQKLRGLKVLGVILSEHERKIRKEALLTSLCKLGEYNLRSLCVNSDRVSNFRTRLSVKPTSTSSPRLLQKFKLDSWCPSPRLLQKFKLEGGYTCSRFPKWINPTLCDLTYLDIRVDQMEEDDLNVLKNLPALVVLLLSIESTPDVADALSRISHGGFRCLTQLHYNDVYGPGLLFGEGAMPKLRKLRLGFRPCKAETAFGGFGFGIRHLPSLKHIEIVFNYVLQFEFTDDFKAVETAIKSEAKLLPVHPEVDITANRLEEPALFTEDDFVSIVKNFRRGSVCLKNTVLR